MGGKTGKNVEKLFPNLPKGRQSDKTDVLLMDCMSDVIMKISPQRVLFVGADGPTPTMAKYKNRKHNLLKTFKSLMPSSEIPDFRKWKAMSEKFPDLRIIVSHSGVPGESDHQICQVYLLWWMSSKYRLI